MNAYTVTQGKQVNVMWDYDSTANPKCDAFLLYTYNIPVDAIHFSKQLIPGGITRNFPVTFNNLGVFEVGIQAISMNDGSITSDVSAHVQVNVVAANPAPNPTPIPNPSGKLAAPTNVRIS